MKPPMHIQTLQLNRSLHLANALPCVFFIDLFVALTEMLCLTVSLLQGAMRTVVRSLPAFRSLIPIESCVVEFFLCSCWMSAKIVDNDRK